jgi:predicted permease
MPLPRWFYSLQATVRALARTRADDELNEELSFHVAMETRNNLQHGMTEEEATRRARLALGGVEQTKERARDVRPLHHFQTILQDAAYALRLIRRAPGFAIVTVLTVALGIGANTAIFTIVNGVLLRPLPYAEPDRLVRIYSANAEQKVPDGTISLPDLDDWRARTRSFESVAATQQMPVILTGRGEAVELQMAFISGDFFGMLGSAAKLGRVLQEDDLKRALPNAVISDRLWRTRFGASPAVVGSSATFLGQAFTIVGVMPPSFHCPTAETDAWGVHALLTDAMIGPKVRNQRTLEGIARLAPGVSVEQASAELNTIAARLATEYPDSNAGWTGATVTPLRSSIVGDVDRALLVILAVVGFILLIGCVNLANLLLARGVSRSGEIAIRAALGAGRLRIIRQFLTESVVLGVIGGMAGIGLSLFGVKTLLALSADTLPRVDDIRIDGTVIAFGLVLTVFTAVLFGILPALRATHVEPQNNLRGGRGTVGRGQRLRSILVVAEISLAMVLLIGAGLMARSLLQLRNVNPGFEKNRLLAATLQLNLNGVSGNVIQHIFQRRAEMVSRVRAIPGVVDAGTVNSMPLQEEPWETFEFSRLDGGNPQSGGKMRLDRSYVSPGYLRTMGIPVVKGDMWQESWEPKPNTPFPFVINETAARRYWPDRDPVGQVVEVGRSRGVIVGVVGDVKQRQLSKDAPAAAYFPQRIGPRIMNTLMVRTAGDPAALIETVRKAIQEMDPNQPIRNIDTLEAIMAESIARDRFFTLLFGMFGALALLLSVIGVYGVFAYSVAQRTQEIGVRMALGAQVRDVLRLVMGAGMQLVVVGVAIGTVLSLLLTRVLSSQLYGISVRDPLTFLLAPAVLAAAALLACYLPARRAARVEAVVALRNN